MKFQKTDEDWFSKNILKFALSLFKRVISPLLLPISGHIAQIRLRFGSENVCLTESIHRKGRFV